jgi:predicted nucleic acid-binding protein
MNNAIFVDTWALLALANRRDSFHSTASICYESIVERSFSLVITDYVLDETITALFKEVRFDEATKFIQALLEAGDSGQIVLEMIDEERFRSAWLLRKIYRDKPDFSFTDLSSFVVMKELRITRRLLEIFTTNRRALDSRSCQSGEMMDVGQPVHNALSLPPNLLRNLLHQCIPILLGHSYHPKTAANLLGQTVIGPLVKHHQHGFWRSDGLLYRSDEPAAG